MRFLNPVFCFIFAILFAFRVSAQEPERFALLIGNQAYSSAVGPLKNPRADVDLVSASLTRLGFKVTILKDASYRQMDVAIKRHLAIVRRAGTGAISFVYYSGHGVAQPETRINYILPIDVTRADADLWYNSFEQQSIIDRMKRQAPKATHYVVFDACRNELNLTGPAAKSLGSEKGFVPVRNTAGILIAYATAPGKTASDAGVGGGAYAKILAKELLTPGIESVGVFRRVQLKVASVIAQEPWLTYGSLPEVFFAGREHPEVADWTRIKDSNKPEEFAAYLKQHPNSQFSDSARLRIKILHERQRNRAAANEWERLETSSNIADLERYIKTYPKHAYSRLARFRIKELREDLARREQVAAWDAVKDTENIDLLQRFLKRHPNSFFTSIAEDKVANLKEAAKQRSQQKSTEPEAARAWEQIRDSNDPDLFAKFIEKFSSSPLAALAADKLNILRSKHLAEMRRKHLASLPKPDAPKPVQPAPEVRGPPETPATEQKKPAQPLEINVAELTKSLQRELDRVGCDPGTIDGVWGARSRQAIERFNEHTKLALDKIAPTLAAVETIRRWNKRVCPKVAAITVPSSRPSTPRKPATTTYTGSRPNAVSYSMSVWGGGSVPTGATRRRNTRYGVLTCVGGSISQNLPRRCWWK